MITSVGWIMACAAMGLFAGLPARSAGRPVHLVVPPPIAKDAAAMPLIVDPVDDAERSINAAVKRFDASLGKYNAECKLSDGAPGGVSREVAATMRGPGYLSFVIRDIAFCGGPYPSAGTMSIVYDLRTGKPVDWTRLLPPLLTGKVTPAWGMDGTRMVTLASRRLYSLYLAGYDRAISMPGVDLDEKDKEEAIASCKETVREEAKPPEMNAWLDAKQGGLAVQFDLAHAVQVCAVPVVIPVATLRAEGASPELLDAIEAAHKE
jgi:hypothetical protein